MASLLLLWRAVCIVRLVVLVGSMGQGSVRAQVLGDDAACLRGLKASVEDSGGRMGSWTSALLSNPCNTSLGSSLQGIVCNNERVFSITLNATNLSGFIPPSLGNCTYLQTIDLSSNQLSGTIPSNIGHLSYLTSLNFSNNQLTGRIPVELSACIYLNIIDLRQNELTGQIPGQLGLLTRLKVFNVTNNQLSGPIPSTLSNSTSTGAPRFNASSFIGNKGLYGYPLPPENIHSLPVAAIVGIGLGSGLLSLLVSFTAVCIWLRITEQGYAAQEGKISQLSSSEY